MHEPGEHGPADAPDQPVGIGKDQCELLEDFVVWRDGGLVEAQQHDRPKQHVEQQGCQDQYADVEARLQAAECESGADMTGEHGVGLPDLCGPCATTLPD